MKKIVKLIKVTNNNLEQVISFMKDYGVEVTNLLTTDEYYFCKMGNRVVEQELYFDEWYTVDTDKLEVCNCSIGDTIDSILNNYGNIGNIDINCSDCIMTINLETANHSKYHCPKCGNDTFNTFEGPDGNVVMVCTNCEGAVRESLKCMNKSLDGYTPINNGPVNILLSEQDREKLIGKYNRLTDMINSCIDNGEDSDRFEWLIYQQALLVNSLQLTGEEDFVN